MIRLLAAVLMAIGCGAWAQTPVPLVTTELSEETVVVGQPLVLRVTVLVPTWMPQPPAFPSMEAPNLIVRLPERSSGPVSQNVDGETWSGVSRAYRLYPMIPGTFALPAQTITLTYADPDTTDPVEAEAPIDGVTFLATVPEGAQALDPLILASDFTLEQTIDGVEGDVLKQGEVVVRTVTAKIDGTSALFVPPLIPPITADAVQAYPKDPVVRDKEDRGELSGGRTDTVSYVAQYGGTLDLPEIAIDWFNIESGAVETATVPGKAYTVEAPPPMSDTSGISPRTLAILGGLLAVVVLLVWLGIRYVLPPLHRLIASIQNARLSSERHAAGQVRKAISERDTQAIQNALFIWETRTEKRAAAEVEEALTLVNRHRYSTQASQAQTSDWQAVLNAFDSARRRQLGDGDPRRSLPPLNPG